MAHVADTPLLLGIASGINLGIDRSLLANGDLTTVAAAKTAVDADVAKLHTAEKMLGVPIKKALEIVDNFLPGYSSGGDVDNYAALPNSGLTKHFWLNL